MQVCFRDQYLHWLVCGVYKVEARNRTRRSCTSSQIMLVIFHSSTLVQDPARRPMLAFYQRRRLLGTSTTSAATEHARPVSFRRDLQSSIPASTSNNSNTYIGADTELELFPSQILTTHDATKPWPATGKPASNLRTNTSASRTPSSHARRRGESRQTRCRRAERFWTGFEREREIFTLGGMGGNFVEAVEQRFVDCPAGARNARADLVVKSINGICGAIGPLIARVKSKTSFLFV